MSVSSVDVYQVQAGKGGHSIGIGLPIGHVSMAMIGVVEVALADAEVTVAVFWTVELAVGIDFAKGVLVVFERLEALVIRF